MNLSKEIEEIFKIAFGNSFESRPDQVEAISELVDGSGRVLVVQRTGWGKSAVYFTATKILRNRGRGPTLIVSPLLALMRDQIESATRFQVRAETLNSNNVDDWQEIHDKISNGDVDALLISPERFNNEEFRKNILIGENLLNQAGLIVVDEAHCISDWGHDFRPDYRRIKDIAASLPTTTPILLTTATANSRVVSDIQEQIGTEIKIFRGTLDRESLALSAAGSNSLAHRLAWLSTNIPSFNESGIVYCLTIRDVELVADWLNTMGVNAFGYSGDMEPEDRIRIEDALKSNDVKAVVATSALGMGYDKPDLGFVVHFQMPSSPVAYYQQVGRAGRAIESASAILMSGPEDEEIWEYFLRSTLPIEAHAREVLKAISDAARSTPDGWVNPDIVFVDVNIPFLRVESLLKLLDVEGFIEYRFAQMHRRKMLRLTAKPYVYDHERIANVDAQRLKEQVEMQEYLELRTCRMAFLRNSLDDLNIANCQRCDNCTQQKFGIAPSQSDVDRATLFFNDRAPKIAARRVYPNRKSIPLNLRIEDGLSVCYLGNGDLGRLVLRDKRKQQGVDEKLINQALKNLVPIVEEKDLSWIAYVPGKGSNRPFVANLAQALGDRLNLPVHAVVSKARETEPQKNQENSFHQFANVDGAFEIVGPVPEGNLLLVDDIVDSRWTLTVVGSLLRANGSGQVVPFTLARQKG
jgi:ATP-dependent DNA helicase RecQ